MIKNYSRLIIAATLLFLGGLQQSHSQVSYTFTPAGATGQNGPTQSMVNTAYASTNLAGQVTVVNGIQYWVVPGSGNYTIEAKGAQGYGSFAGRGAHMKGDFTLTGGDTLKILVGQKAPPPVSSMNQYAGGGGSFVTYTNNTPLIVAGGGGGNHGTSFATSCDASTTTSGFAGVATNSGSAGTSGSGGGTASSADGGGGLLGSGGGIGGGKSFTIGGQGGKGTTTGHGEGGFGCGGGTSSWDNYRAGGGGGYSGGGGAGENSQTGAPQAGGGGSYNNGLNQTNLAGVQLGDGEIIITQMSSAMNDAGIQSIISPKNNCVGTYDVQAIVVNYGKNQITSVQINWSLNTVAQTPMSYTMLLDTFNGIGQNKDTVTLGTVSLTAGNTETVKVWTTLPNNVTDTATSNDSKTITALGYAYPTVNLGPDVFICPEDSATFNGGSTHDSLIWSNSATTQTITVNAQGKYLVSVFKNGCETKDSATVTHFPGAPAVDLGQDTTLCFGDSLILNATTAGMTYEWQDMSTNPTFTVTKNGVYKVTIEDANGCNNDDAINITYYLEPNVTIYVAPSNDLCFGVPQTFTAFPLTQGSIDYQWKINGVNQGAQTTSPTFNGPADHGDSVSVDLITDICATNPYPVPSNKIGMTVNPKPKALTGKLLVKENTTETYVVPLTTGSAFVWRVSGGTISGDSTKNIVTIDWGAANPNATLTCQETDVKNCVRPNLYDVNVVSIVGVDNIAKGFGLGNAYPNPSNNMVNIPIHTDQNRDITLQLFDMSGKMVKTIFHGTITSDKNIQVSVDDLNNGLYIYKLTTADGYMSVKKLTVEH